MNPAPYSYLDAVRRGSPARVVLSVGARPSTQPTTRAVDEQPEEALQDEGATRPPKPKRRPAKKKGSQPRWRSPAARRGRVPVHLRLGRRVTDGQGAAERMPARLSLGHPSTRRGRRRIYAPDADGWREVRREVIAAAQAHRPPRRRRPIPEFMRDRCLNCLSYTHKVATCRVPLRCLNFRGYRHLARDCK